MEEVLRWVKGKWMWVLGTFGILIVALGTIFNGKKAKEDKIAPLHENKVSGLNMAKQIEINANEATVQAVQKYKEKQVVVETNKQAQIDNLKNMEQIDLTEVVADRFGFKNGDKQ
jgi:hypothetical protein